MKNKKAILLMWVLALLPAVILLIVQPYLPQQIPVHWDLRGNVSYGGKETLWIMAGMTVASAALLQFLPRIDPKRKNYEKFQGAYELTGVLLPLFMLLMMGIILVETFRPGTLDVGRVVMVLVGLLFTVLGCLMGKVKRNWFMGVRTPWALDDPDVWNKTQRLGGWVFFLTGLAMIPLALLAPESVSFAAMMTLLLGGVALTYFMSWKWFRDKQRP